MNPKIKNSNKLSMSYPDKKPTYINPTSTQNHKNIPLTNLFHLLWTIFKPSQTSVLISNKYNTILPPY